MILQHKTKLQFGPVARALLRRGRPYDKAVETFEPYDRIQEPNEGARAGMRPIAQRAMHERKEGTLKSGKSGKTVKSKKQAIAIGLSEARKKGKKVPKTKAA